MSITIEGFLVAAISDADLFSAFLKLTLTMILSLEVNTSLSATDELLNNKLFSRVDLLVVDRFLSLFFLVFFDFLEVVVFPFPAALLLGSSSLITLRLFEVLFLEVFLDLVVLTGDREIDRDRVVARFFLLLVVLVRDLDLFFLFFLFVGGTGETDCRRLPIRPIRFLIGLLIGDLDGDLDQDLSDLFRVLRDRDLNGGERDFDLESDLDRDLDTDRFLFFFLFLDRDLLGGSDLLGSGDLDLLGGVLEADDLERLDTGDRDRLGIGDLDDRLGRGDFETLFDPLGLDRDLERERDGGDLDFEP